jgi:hypothetical protein
VTLWASACCTTGPSRASMSSTCRLNTDVLTTGFTFPQTS